MTHAPSNTKYKNPAPYLTERLRLFLFRGSCVWNVFVKICAAKKQVIFDQH